MFMNHFGKISESHYKLLKGDSTRMMNSRVR